MSVPREFDVATCAEDFASPECDIRVVHKGDRYAARGMLVHTNGWDITVWWGYGAYCDSARPSHALGGVEWPPETSPNAGVSVSKRGERFVLRPAESYPDSMYAGWQSPAAVVWLLDAARRGDEQGMRAAMDVRP